MKLRDYAKAPRKAIVGTSLTVTAPTGEYDNSKLINLGTNRWGFKPEVGVAVPKGRWDIDAYLGVWLFTDNDDFFPGGRLRSQDKSSRSRATRATPSGCGSGRPSMRRGTRAAAQGSTVASRLAP